MEEKSLKTHSVFYSMEINGIEIKWLGHAGFLIKNSKILYIDPYKIKDGLEKADIILITHSHYDHCSIEDIEKIIKEGTKIIMPADCQSKILKFKAPVEMIIIEPGQEIVLGNIRITAFPAYNIDKSFHQKEDDWVGYFLKMNEVMVYHAGDTDNIPEMQRLTGHKHNGKKFIVLLPVGGRFTMSAEEAADVAKLLKPDLAIPMHYGSIIGSKEDAQEFCDMCKEFGIECMILEKI